MQRQVQDATLQANSRALNEQSLFAQLKARDEEVMRLKKRLGTELGNSMQTEGINGRDDIGTVGSGTAEMAFAKSFEQSGGPSSSANPNQSVEITNEQQSIIGELDDEMEGVMNTAE